MKIHLGCGTKRMEGWLNVDQFASLKPDLVVDLAEFPWPWPDNSVEEIYSHHVFEHLANTCATMMECWRILKPGGTVETIVPYAANQLYLQDPTHCRPWTDVTVDYFLNDHPYNHKYTEHGFELVFCYLRDQVEDAPPPSLNRLLRAMLPGRVKKSLRYVLLGMFDEVHFKLRKPDATAR